MNLLRHAAIAAVLLAGATVAQAEEIRLSDHQLDTVNAGFIGMPNGSLGGLGGLLGGFDLSYAGGLIGSLGSQLGYAQTLIGGQLGGGSSQMPYIEYELPDVGGFM